jgi:hypothetical protein
VFASKKPTVEAVRSVRASDPELLSQFGRIALVASGGGGDSLTTLDHSIVKGVINDRGGAGFSRDDGRGAPYNLRSDLAALDSRLRTAGVADIGFAFAVTDPRVPAGRAAPTIATSVGNTPVTFHYDSAAQVYVRTLDGQRLRTADGASFAAKNVIIQFCQVSVHPGDVDVMGNPSQYTHTVGSGRAVLFRNGHRVLGRWSRKSASSPTLYTDAAGVRLRQAPGPTIVVLAANGAPF